MSRMTMIFQYLPQTLPVDRQDMRLGVPMVYVNTILDVACFV